MIGWYIGLIGILIGIIGGFFFLKSMLKMKGDLRKSLVGLVIASFIYVLFSSIIVILGLNKYVELNSIIWQAVPVLFTLSTICFFIGSKKLVTLLESLSQRQRGKNKK